MDAFGWLTTILTILYFIINAGEISPIVKLKSASGFPIFPFLSAFSNAVLWTEYGLIIGDAPITIVNAFGIITSSIAIIVYYWFGYEMNRDTIETAIFSHLSLLTLLVISVYYRFVSLTFFSVIACTSSILMYAAPLAGLRRMIKTKDFTSLSERLVSITFVVCTVWLVYGWRTNDWFVIVPNLVGTLISIVQATFLLFVQRKEEAKLSVYELLPISNK